MVVNNSTGFLIRQDCNKRDVLSVLRELLLTCAVLHFILSARSLSVRVRSRLPLIEFFWKLGIKLLKPKLAKNLETSRLVQDFTSIDIGAFFLC